MPGSSLWLVPPPSHPLHGIITTLITTTLPSKFPSEAGGGGGSNPVLFATHMTLTSEILPATYNKDSGIPNLKHLPTDEEKQHAQTWLDALPLPPANKVHVRLDRVDTQDVFFRRCFIRVLYEGVEDIVGIAREYSVTRGSSSIHDGGGGGDDDAGSPISGATREWLARWKEAFGPHVSLIYGSTPITKDKLAQISAAIEEAGVVLGASHLAAESGAGWDGGVVWLVPTDRPIGDWKPIATRTLV